jgi:hypothetical protein
VTYTDNPDYKHANSYTEKYLCSIGVPRHYWTPSPVPDTFADLKVGSRSVSPAKQQEDLYDYLNSKDNLPLIFSKAPLLVVGSEPTDNDAMSILMFFCRSMVKRSIQVSVTNAADLHGFHRKEEDFLSSSSDKPRVAFLYGVTEESTPQRMEAARDWVERNSGIFRVLAVGGNPAIVCAEKMRKLPDGYLYVGDSKTETAYIKKSKR